MSNYPENLKYTKDHEWARKEGSQVIIGVTFHAQESLGDVVFVELPKVGSSVSANKQFGVIESTKAVSELFAPISGKVVEVNTAIVNEPSTVNSDPYGAGWMLKIEPSKPDELDSLLDAQAYQNLLKNA
jgi:glycine cleavage system H protein